jgi:hypothetical protein
MNRARKRLLRARLSHAQNVATRSAASRQHGFFITEKAAGFGPAAIDPKEKWHEKILNAELS